LPIMAACMMTNKKSSLINVPKIKEVDTMIKILISMGAKIDYQDNRMILEPPEKLDIDNLDVDLAKEFRSLLNFLAVLSTQYEKFDLPVSGGCKIGKRTIVPHIYALDVYGIKVIGTDEGYSVSRMNGLMGGRVVMSEASDTGTNIAVLGAVFATGKTIIRNASSNYMVRDLCNALVEMGASISGIGTDTIEIMGVNELNGLDNYPIISDPINAFSYIALGVITKSDLTIRRIPFEFIELDLFLLEKMGVNFEVLDEYKSPNGHYLYRDIRITESDLEALEDKIHTAAAGYGHGINMDNMPIFSLVAARAKGETLLCDWGYEGRQEHFSELEKMGLQYEILDHHRVKLSGVQNLNGANVKSPYLRAGMVLVAAGLIAKDQTVIENAFHVHRGYPNVISKLRGIGADISD
jgi:UDP-N-acetylglucosamine 1-carboxyvinyltransferase